MSDFMVYDHTGELVSEMPSTMTKEGEKEFTFNGGKYASS